MEVDKKVIDETTESINPDVETWDDEQDPVISEIEQLKSKVDENMNKYLRALADSDNIRKQCNLKVANIEKYQYEKLMVSLLDTIDNFERAFNNYNENSSKLTKKGIEILEGMSNIYKGFCSVLRNYGLTALPINKGDQFNVDFMEAVSIIPGNGENTVEQVICKCYIYNDKVIRYAKVIVKN